MAKKSLYQVQHISKSKTQNGRTYYRVKWLGYPSSQNTWQPEQHLSREMIKLFEQDQERRSMLRDCRMYHKSRGYQLGVEGRGRGWGRGGFGRSFFKICERRSQRSQDGGVLFVVMNGIRKQTATRDYIYQRFPQKLAQFYIKQLQKRQKQQQEPQKNPQKQK